MPLLFNGVMKTLFLLFLLLVSASTFADNPYSAEAAIYKVEAVKQDGTTFNGTGVLIAQDKILTNCHIVNKGGWPRVIRRRTGDTYRVTKYYQLGNLDACVLVGGFDGPPVPLSDRVVIGENVWLYGYPSGLPVLGQGSVRALVEGGKSLLLGAFCSPGSSGGPVLNVRGELIGLNYAVYQYQNNCLSIPVDLLRPFLQG